MSAIDWLNEGLRRTRFEIFSTDPVVVHLPGTGLFKTLLNRVLVRASVRPRPDEARMWLLQELRKVAGDLLLLTLDELGDQDCAEHFDQTGPQVFRIDPHVPLATIFSTLVGRQWVICQWGAKVNLRMLARTDLYHKASEAWRNFREATPFLIESGPDGFDWVVLLAKNVMDADTART